MAKRYDGIWPPPVYVAQFAGGEKIAMSYGYSAKAKAPPFEAAPGMVCQVIGSERRQAIYGMEFNRRIVPEPATDIVAGHFERITYQPSDKLHRARGGFMNESKPVGMRGSLIQRGLAVYQTRTVEVIPDPFFAPAANEPGEPQKRSRSKKTPKLVVDNSELIAARQEIEALRAQIAELKAAQSLPILELTDRVEPEPHASIIARAGAQLAKLFRAA